MFKIMGAIVTIVAAVGLAIIAWPQFFGLEQTMVSAHAVALRGTAIAIALVLAVGFLLLSIAKPMRAFSGAMAGLFVLFAATSGLIIAERGIGASFGITNVSSAAGQVTVLSWNTLEDAVDAGTIAAVAVKYGADIVALPEASAATAAAAAAAMTAAARPMVAHTVAFDPDRKAYSTSLLISTGLGAYSVVSPAERGHDENTLVVPSVVAVPENGSGPSIVAVHAVAPLPALMDSWRGDLAWLSSLCGATSDIILAGDFNATLDNVWRLRGDDRSFGACQDAADRAGAAALGTWPTALPSVLGAPIDHIMSTPNWRTIDLHVLTDLDEAGSDHRPIVATLAPLTAS